MNKNDQAKNFTADINDGSTLTLKDLKGKKVWISFFRYASCPLCNLRIHELIKEHSKLKEQGIELLAVFQSSKESVDQYVAKQDVPFPIICDPEQKLYDLYNIQESFTGLISIKVMFRMIAAMLKGFFIGKVEGSFTRLPAEYLIDESQMIKHIYYGKTITDHIPLEKVYDVFKP